MPSDHRARALDRRRGRARRRRSCGISASASASDIGIAGAPGGISQRTLSLWPSASRTSTAAGNRPLSGRSSACLISIKAMNFCTSGSRERLVGELGAAQRAEAQRRRHAVAQADPRPQGIGRHAFAQRHEVPRMDMADDGRDLGQALAELVMQGDRGVDRRMGRRARGIGLEDDARLDELERLPQRQRLRAARRRTG